MNIFVLSRDPAKAAQFQCDSHINEMIDASTHILCSVFSDKDYKSAELSDDHPCSLWIRRSFENFCWMLEHALALCMEYSYRFGSKHPSEEIIEWCETGLINVEKIIPSRGITPFPQILPDDVRHRNPVRAYRNYYLKYLKSNAVWTRRDPPDWWGINC